MTPDEPLPIAITFGKRLRAWRRRKSYAIHAARDACRQAQCRGGLQVTQ
jgi:hypothetical protein